MLEWSDLQPERYYWARRNRAAANPEVVYISTIFGTEPEYWTVALLEHETHAMIDEFDFLEIISGPSATL